MAAHPDNEPVSVNQRAVEKLRGVFASELFWIAVLTLFSLLVRLWNIGGKGLWYDEAITALMARARPGEIVQFHWRSAFEHPPLWALLMHFWSAGVGQSEAALRLPSAIAGALLVPAVWSLVRYCWPQDRLLRFLAALFVSISPILILYSQETRMYATVTLLAVVSILLYLRLLQSSGILALVLFVATNALMLGFHYYAIILIGAEALYTLIVWRKYKSSRAWLLIGLGVSASLMALWAVFSPGFRMTFSVVINTSYPTATALLAFGDRFWRELAFGSVVWLPPQAVIAYSLLPLLLLGIFAVWRYPGDGGHGRLLLVVFLLPVIASLAFPTRILTRYILFIAPVFYVLLAAGIRLLWRRSWRLGAIGILVPVAVAVLGLGYYFGHYQKSAYRDVASYLRARISPESAVLIEGPRQHLLTKYYLPEAQALYPIPEVSLPAHWPITARPVVPEQTDGYLRDILHKHRDVWLVLAGQAEVDQSGFVPKYLAAIAYNLGCWEQLDVRWCHYLSPGSEPAGLTVSLDQTYNGEMRIDTARLLVSEEPNSHERHLLVELDWQALAKPSIDYRVTLRLVDAEGRVVDQLDSEPIGPLLPTPSWNLGDIKPGYMALAIPPDSQERDYRVELGVYDAQTGSLFEPRSPRQVPDRLVKVATVNMDANTVQLAP